MASKPGGYSGGDRGPMGSHTGAGSASGRGFDRPDKGFSRGMQGATARRSPVQSPSYEASLGNLATLASRSMPGAGMVLGAGLDIAGARPGFTGYQGHVNTPGSYDPKGGPQMNGGGGVSDLALQRHLLTSGYGGGNRAFYTPGMASPGLLRAAPQAPQPPQIAPQQITAQTYSPKALSTPGLLAYGVKQPGYGYF